MEEVDVARLDVAELSGVAREYDAVADLVDATIRARLSQPVFDGSSAGRAHTFHGDAVRSALDDLADPLRQWARAAGEVAGLLRSCTERYVGADTRAAGRMG